MSTSSAFLIMMLFLSFELIAIDIFSIGISLLSLKFAICPKACTPASVLPDAISSTSSLVISYIAFSISP